MPGPKLRYADGTEEVQDSGTTLADIRSTFNQPNYFLVNGSEVHRAGVYVLQNNTTYELKLPPNISNAGKY